MFFKSRQFVRTRWESCKGRISPWILGSFEKLVGKPAREIGSSPQSVVVKLTPWVEAFPFIVWLEATEAFCYKISPRVSFEGFWRKTKVKGKSRSFQSFSQIPSTGKVNSSFVLKQNFVRIIDAALMLSLLSEVQTLNLVRFERDYPAPKKLLIEILLKKTKRFVHENYFVQKKTLWIKSFKHFKEIEWVSCLMKLETLLTWSPEETPRSKSIIYHLRPS